MLRNMELTKMHRAITSEIVERADTLAKAMRPIVAAYRASADPGTSDLDREQPFNITVTLGALRDASIALAKWET